MKTPQPSRLERALLGLLHANPMSGYEVRKLFATTPLEVWSDSPGSIYPALRRLERGGLVTGRQEKAETRRPRRVFELTDAGRKALRNWLEEPVRIGDVKSRSGDLILRFALMPSVVGLASTLEFLAQWEAGLRAHKAEVEAYLGGAGKDLPLTGRLAVENGLGEIRAHVRWARHAAERLRASANEEETT
jgi:DNA-binding PadR family transcriptional regulator